MNILALKWRMRKYAREHKPPIVEKPRMVMLPVWGAAARALSYRICGSTDAQKCWAFLFPPTLGVEVMQVAATQVGVHEIPAGSNDGPRVHVYQVVTGAFKQPWCASFVSWCYVTAAKNLGKTVRLAPLPAYVPSWTAMIRAGQRGWRRVEPAEARAGDVVTLWGSAHVELVDSCDRDAHILHCIGGNTAVAGQNSNGGEVCRTTRGFAEATVVGRFGS